MVCIISLSCGSYDLQNITLVGNSNYNILPLNVAFINSIYYYTLSIPYINTGLYVLAVFTTSLSTSASIIGDGIPQQLTSTQLSPLSSIYQMMELIWYRSYRLLTLLISSM